MYAYTHTHIHMKLDLTWWHKPIFPSTQEGEIEEWELNVQNEIQKKSKARKTSLSYLARVCYTVSKVCGGLYGSVTEYLFSICKTLG